MRLEQDLQLQSASTVREYEWDNTKMWTLSKQEPSLLSRLDVLATSTS